MKVARAAGAPAPTATAPPIRSGAINAPSAVHQCHHAEAGARREPLSRDSASPPAPGEPCAWRSGLPVKLRPPGGAGQQGNVSAGGSHWYMVSGGEAHSGQVYTGSQVGPYSGPV